MTASLRLRVLASLLAPIAAACTGRFEGLSDLRARKVVLQREVSGMREIVTRLERGEPMLPLDDVAVAIDDSLLRDLIGAQLPLELDVDRYHVSLKEAEVQFRGSPVVRLRGTLYPRERPDLEAAVSVIGALERIRVDPSSSILTARIAVDHLGVEKAAGIGSVLSGAALDEMARRIRLSIEDRLPPIQIPVKVQQSIDLPAVTRGPVRIDGARMPLQVAVSQVVAAQGRLWIAVHFRPGDLVKTADAPPAGDADASEVLGADDDGSDSRAARGGAKKR